MSAPEDLVFSCPGCNGAVVVKPTELNCRIFRHAAFKHSLQPIHPHAPKVVCDQLVASGAVFGCGKPFRIVTAPDGSLLAEACDYI